MAGEDEADSDCSVDMCTTDMAHRVGHNHDADAKGKGCDDPKG